MTSHEGQDLPRHGAGVLDDDVASAWIIRDMVDHQGSSACGCAIGKKGVQDVLDDPVLLWDQLRWVVLDVLGFADELREEAHEGVLIEVT